eukprot:s2435_g13.t1
MPFRAVLFGVLDKPTCVAMWLSLMAMLRTAELCVQLLWQDLPFLKYWGAPCATHVPGRLLSGIAFAPCTARRMLLMVCMKCFGCIHGIKGFGGDGPVFTNYGIVLKFSGYRADRARRKQTLDFSNIDCVVGQDVEILQHKVVNDGQQLVVLLQEATEPHRQAWVSDSAVPEDVLSKCMRQVGGEKLKPCKRPHPPEQTHTAAASYIVPPLELVQPHGDLLQSSDSTDLMSVTCSTHKESNSAQRQLAKSAGLLCACLSERVILYIQEIYGCESLSQRYLCVAALKDLLPSLSTVVRDDACHLHKDTQRRAMHSAAAADIAPPSVTYVCDKFHMAGHTDEWCKQTCDPALPANATRLHGVRTSVCEFTFTWLSKYKHQTKHMNEYGFHFFLLDMAWSHNEIILQGGCRPEEVASSLTLENREYSKLPGCLAHASLPRHVRSIFFV